MRRFSNANAKGAAVTMNTMRSRWWVETNAVSMPSARLISVISANPPGANASHRGSKPSPVARLSPNAATTASASMNTVTAMLR